MFIDNPAIQTKKKPFNKDASERVIYQECDPFIMYFKCQVHGNDLLVDQYTRDVWIIFCGAHAKGKLKFGENT